MQASEIGCTYTLNIGRQGCRPVAPRTLPISPSGVRDDVRMGFWRRLSSAAGGVDEPADGPTEPPSGKRWNGSNWEVDGEQVTYRVTWRSSDDDSTHQREFTDIDQGYSFYEMVQKDARSHGARWEHVPW